MTPAGKDITWGETHVGTRQAFEDDGFFEVAHPTVRRVVMRIGLTWQRGRGGGHPRFGASRRRD